MYSDRSGIGLELKVKETWKGPKHEKSFLHSSERAKLVKEKIKMPNPNIKTKSKAE